MIYRIKQISENEFIPMCGTFIDFIFRDMYAIDQTNVEFLWRTDSIVKQYCIVNTLAKAKSIIIEYKNLNKKIKGFPKYYKV